MKTRSHLITLTILVLALSFGCSSGGGNNTDGGDGSNTTKKDGSSTTLPDAEDDFGFNQPDFTSNPDGNTTTDKVTCLEIVGCAQQNRCQTQQCIDQCATGAGQSTITKFNALGTCFQGAQAGACKTDCAANPQATTCLSCVQTACGTEVQACQTDDGGGTTTNPDGGNTTNDGGASGTKSCSEVWKCQEGATSQDEFTKCYTDGTSTAQGQVDAIDACLQNKGSACQSKCSDWTSSACQTCWAQQCPTEFQACGLNPTVVYGTKKCDEIWNCQVAAQDQTTYDKCYTDGTQQGQKDLDAIDACLGKMPQGACSTECAGSWTDVACQACFAQQCPTEFTTCGLSFNTDGGTPGDTTPSDAGVPDGNVKPDTSVADIGTTTDTVTTSLDCLGLVDCLSKCTQGDQTCASNCEKQATSSAVTKYNAFYTCYSGQVSGGCKASCATTSSQTCITCVQGACSSQISACQAD